MVANDNAGCLVPRGVNQGFIASRQKGGASSLTPTQLRVYAIDSQVLSTITLPPRFEACLANKKSFDMIRAIEFAAPKDFISLKL
ncbi:hypothetical protein DKY63_08920 [Pseudomonas putida]|uniref:Uncharacterized protein n=1 Tax=Pseudomonas putida TaxID=303 RepID=A0A2Z4RG29_PSEPU|nr:hypothetical protein DKY63_08920 [Pseudomonas putida]